VAIALATTERGTLVQVSLGDARDKLSQLVQAVIDGEQVTITRHGEPAVELVPAKRKRAPQFGTMKDRIKIVDPAWRRPQGDIEAWLRGDV
jgi:prevent-host-death family protein